LAHRLANLLANLYVVAKAVEDKKRAAHGSSLWR